MRRECMQWPLAVLLGIAALTSACGEDTIAGTPPPSAEASVRAELGIPAEATRVLILSQSSHLDWDWVRTFEDYFQRSVDRIFTDAIGLVQQYHSAPHHYFYSIAEMAFLQRFITAHPDAVQQLREVGQDLRIVGGGITSPDNLLPSGEAFIRDYLVGKTWVSATLGLPIRQAWIPDDFGHDSQLPIVLEAMGMEGVGFARVPGVDSSRRFAGIDAPAPQSQAAQLLQEGIDFVWQANDGSEALAHWMPGSYCQGDPSEPFGHAIASPDDLRPLIATDGPASPTPYIFVPVGCDFAKPNSNLLAVVEAWNAQEYPSSGVWAVVATFDHYVQLVAAHRDVLHTRHFNPTPYWTGYYASRPLLKVAHLRATQALLGAEIFGAIADAASRDDLAAWQAAVRTRTAAVDAAWAALVPANHHDFITGTAVDRVYETEQIPHIQDAVAQGEARRSEAMAIAAASIAPAYIGERALVVFNQLGLARTGLTETSETNVDLPNGTGQPSADGTTLFMARAPSLGYATGDLAATAVSTEHAVTVTVSADGDAVILENAALRATVRRDAAWALTSLIDKHGVGEMLAAGAAANSFHVYDDDGGLYRFGNEMEGCTLKVRSTATESAGGDISVLESGPLRARIVGQVQLGGKPFQKEYQLVADEPFLRMRSTGAAPTKTSVFVHFPLAGPIDTLVHGTPYHWDRKAAARAGDLTFEATHEFVIASSEGQARGAVFHAGVPAWAAQPDGTLVGAVWRNAVQERCDLYGANGTDADPHTVDYALRIASGILPPEQGQQLREALAFETPLQTVVGTPAGHLPREFSLASASPDTAIITAAKSGSADFDALLLRVYQPSNARLDVTVRTAAAQRFPSSWPLDVQGRTALESALAATSASRLALSGSADQFRFAATRALTTIRLGRHTP